MLKIPKSNERRWVLNCSRLINWMVIGFEPLKCHEAFDLFRRPR
jgi:hypothetical protein